MLWGLAVLDAFKNLLLCVGGTGRSEPGGWDALLLGRQMSNASHSFFWRSHLCLNAATAGPNSPLESIGVSRKYIFSLSPMLKRFSHSELSRATVRPQLCIAPREVCRLRSVILQITPRPLGLDYQQTAAYPAPQVIRLGKPSTMK